MDKDGIFTTVQKHMSDISLLLIGTGGSIPYCIPGMPELAKHLLHELEARYKSDSQWKQFCERLKDGQDLETALTGLLLSPTIIDDVTRCTWELISQYDLELFSKVLSGTVTISLGELLRQMFEKHPQCVNVITTNYDRVIEYACDQFRLPSTTLCSGNYFRRIIPTNIKSKNIANILKVHGSLDWFETENGAVYSIPLQHHIPPQMKPRIIPPGSLKYQSILQPPNRDILTLCDTLITNAKGFLCIGYGFNDEQIQVKIVESARLGNPVIVVTKTLSDKVLSMLVNSCRKFVAIQAGSKSDFTDICIGKERIEIEGTYWTVDGFMKMWC